MNCRQHEVNLHNGGFALAPILLVLTFGVLAPAQNAPPPSWDQGPSLEVTMKFIQDKLGGIGPVNFAVYVHDNVAGNDWAVQFKGELSKVVADPSACRIDYHWKMEKNGAVAEDFDDGFSLKAVKDITVMPMEQNLKEHSIAAGHPSWSRKVNPPAVVLKVRRTDKENEINEFSFFDEPLANRVAKAIVHAVDLCGGGAKKEAESF